VSGRAGEARTSVGAAGLERSEVLAQVELSLAARDVLAMSEQTDRSRFSTHRNGVDKRRL
jgi:hypothetical protein